MKKSILALAAVFCAGTAQAGKLVCAGNYYGHSVNIRATTSGGGITGPVHMKVSGPFHNEEGDLRATRSYIDAGKIVNFTATSDRAVVDLSANFRSGTTYVGSIAVQGDGNSATVNVSCRLSGRTFEDEPDYEI